MQFNYNLLICVFVIQYKRSGQTLSKLFITFRAAAGDNKTEQLVLKRRQVDVGDILIHLSINFLMC